MIKARRSDGRAGWPQTRSARAECAEADADIAAVDRGEGRTVACLFRGSYGRYPRRFRQQVMDLTLGSVVLRPWWYSLHRKPIVIAEPISGAQVRIHVDPMDENYGGLAVLVGLSASIQPGTTLSG